MINKKNLVLMMVTALLVAGCGNSEDRCAAEKSEVAVLKAIVELHKSRFESRSVDAAGHRATDEMRQILQQRDDNIRLAQEAEIRRLEEKLLGLSQELQQAQAGDAAVAAAKQAELDAALLEARQLRSSLEAHKQNQRTVESRIQNLREVRRENLKDETVFPPPTTGGDDVDEKTSEQDLVAMAMVAGVCYAASGGLCAIVAADFLQGVLGGSTTEEDIKKMGSIIDKTSNGEPLSDEERKWLRGKTRDMFEGNENVQETLIDVLGGSKTLDESFEETAKQVINDKIGEENLQQIERLIDRDISCRDLKDLLNEVDDNNLRNIRKILPILQKELRTKDPDAATCLGELAG